MKPALFLAFILLFGCISLPSPTGEQVSSTPQAPTAPADTSTTDVPTANDTSDTVPDPVDTTEVPDPVVPEENDTTDTTEPVKASIASEEISYNSFGWEIHGTLYPAVDKKNPTKGIILVPMLDHTRSSYPASFIEDLHKEVPDALILAIDARGHGESTNLGTWDEFGLEEWLGMAVDVKHAKKYFKEKYPTADEYYVVGASIGSTAAIIAGEQENDITRVAMLSPGIEYKGVNIEGDADDYVHALFIAYTKGDAYSASSASQIYSITSSKTTMKSYSGSSHGTDMFDDTEVSSDLVDFLKK